jgi:hypothetical protein
MPPGICTKPPEPGRIPETGILHAGAGTEARETVPPGEAVLWPGTLLQLSTPSSKSGAAERSRRLKIIVLIKRGIPIHGTLSGSWRPLDHVA